jgi:hypothetical protein
MHFDFHTEAVHPNRAADMVAAVDGIAAGNNVQHFAVVWNGDSARFFNRFVEIWLPATLTKARLMS